MPEQSNRHLDIRPANESDMPAITAIYATAVRESTASFELIPPTETEMTARWQDVIAAGFPYVAAADEAGTLQGYAFLHAFHARAAYAATVENTVYVHEDARRTGTASALMSALTDAARMNGYREILAVISDPQDNPSIPFHARHGFAQVGYLTGVGQKFGRWIDVVIMQLSIRA